MITPEIIMSALFVFLAHYQININKPYNGLLSLGMALLIMMHGIHRDLRG